MSASASAFEKKLLMIENLFVMIGSGTVTIDSDLQKSPLYFPLRLWENEEGFTSLYIQEECQSPSTFLEKLILNLQLQGPLSYR